MKKSRKERFLSDMLMVYDDDDDNDDEVEM